MVETGLFPNTLPHRHIDNMRIEVEGFTFDGMALPAQIDQDSTDDQVTAWAIAQLRRGDSKIIPQYLYKKLVGVFTLY